ncbi:hypothetical protein [Sulfuricaulis sp.]|uniref:hypothetical protein n=1 Tax=Sulfuricaulis sp. TaxID=2003553 RepID=UPI003C74D509
MHRVAVPDESLLFSSDNIHAGQQGFLKCGLMHDGTICGPGALFRAPRRIGRRSR